jgi:hypothetical protein
LDLNERIFRKCLRDLNFKQLWIRHAVDPFDAVLADDRLREFLERRYPQMVAALEGQRAKGRTAMARPGEAARHRARPQARTVGSFPSGAPGTSVR